MAIFSFRSKMGQERSLARMTKLKASKEGSGIYAILISDLMKGYCFVEGEDQLSIENSLSGIKVISGRAVGNREVPLSEISVLLNPRPSIEGLGEGDFVEIIDGPFKGFKAKITRIEDTSQEVTAELVEATMSLPVRIHADYVKKLSSDEKSGKQKDTFGKFNL
ncbi:MAG: transcription elongation factor Spt5 [Candidatus Heimdallarchaeota archaeon]|nr:transcription elongation factor Spt5 [Candidatus Heimdallarchaeota archaeon]MDH5646465.1 transcription elongation factor Spt5 [Candidatus Heimdallarchaeota archaeon]